MLGNGDLCMEATGFLDCNPFCIEGRPGPLPLGCFELLAAIVFGLLKEDILLGAALELD